MSDSELFDALPAQVSPARQIACVMREIGKRRHVYPRLVLAQKLTQAKAGDEIAAMEAVLVSVKVAEASDELVRFTQTIAGFRPGGVDLDDDADTITSLRTRARAILKKMGRRHGGWQRTTLIVAAMRNAWRRSIAPAIRRSQRGR